MSRHSKRCPNCQQFVASIDGHTCPEDEPLPTEDELNHGGSIRRDERDDGTATIEAKDHPRIRTLEQLIAACEVDLNRWRVKRHVVNKWEMGYKDAAGEAHTKQLFQVKAWLEPRRDMIDLDELREALLQDIRQASFRREAPEYPGLGRDDGFMLEINISDHHVGMLAWAAETGEAHYDSGIATRLFQWAVRDIIEQAETRQGRIEEVVFVVGNDLLHVDTDAGHGSGGATTAGTIQDVDSRRKKLARMVVDMVREAVEETRRIAPVKLIVVPGNHDEDAAFNLGMVLEAVFEGDLAVEVDNAPKARKYHRFGKVLLGFTHGKDESTKRLPMLMPIECPNGWAASHHREWHIGHTHHKQVRGFAMEVEEDMSVRIRVFPSLAPSDAYHARKGFRSLRAAEGYLWHREYGFAGLLPSTPRSAEEHAT